ncbi:hypothetical protein GGP80_003353 [Salinibacter ruber]|nr:hypothetical protein [Salinibacter ruber]
MIDSWKDEATTDPEQIRTWFADCPNANLGVATGQWDEPTGLLVVDIDVPGGYDTWKELRGKHPDNSPAKTLTVESPSGGRHLYYATVPGVPIKSAKDTLGDSVDTKGHGGYVVAPPSSTDSGAYTFDGDVKGIAPAPTWLVSAAKKSASETDKEQLAGGGDFEWTDNLVEEAMQAIGRPSGYGVWYKLIAAVKDAASSDNTAVRLLKKHWPEKKYDYTERVNNAADDQITSRTLSHHATANGWTPPWERTDAAGQPSGDGQAGGAPKKPGDSHPDSWYEDDPTGYSDEEDEEDEFTLEDFQIESVPELLNSDIRPPEPLITYDGRSLLHEGTSQLAAKPKIGKTNLAMNMGLAIASEGGKALGKAEVQRHGRVLMLNLDGSRRGSYDRFQTMTANDPDGAPDRFDILHDEFPKVGDGALGLLKDYCTEYPDTELIIVDTLQHLRPTSDGRRNVYHEDYEFVHPIAELGRKTDTSILLVHHLNKIQNGDELDKVSGSTGLTGAVENVMILDRARGETKAELSIRPREDREEDFDLEFDGRVQTWIVGDKGYEPGSEARAEVWDVLVNSGHEMKVGLIADHVDKQPQTVSKTLGRMIDGGAPVKKVKKGVYRAVSRDT